MKIIRFSILYTDPPWQYSNSQVQGSAENHYSTLSIDDMCALPMSEIAEDDSVMFLWTTFPMLTEALRLIKEWGFTYKSIGFLWLKQNKKSETFFFGLGFWTRGNAEVCLLATRGKPRRKDNSVSQLIISPIEAHSKKPDIVRDKIVTLMGDLSRIEIFARERVEGWVAIGNEIDGLDIRDALEGVIQE